ncbi:MAG: GNAT family N-acetyltransferase [Lachnospiraceae bacterium]|nr:GNAT family N-acetyltransferase [Lachnospiraceae bacterium]
MLNYHRVTEEEMHIISNWKYPGEYAIYNNIPYSEQVREHRGFANPDNHHFSFYDDEVLVGYINLREKDKEIFIGVGVNPELCNRGYGQVIVKMACEIVRNFYPDKMPCMEVRTWNTRAIRCYEKAGFHIAGEAETKTTQIGEGKFYKMLL